jgi:DNA-binding NarL/FixJ family response regulator
MNGIEVAREIAGIAPGTAIVMFTMYCFPSLSRDAKAAGVHHVFSKSDGPLPMVASLKNLCDGC